MARKWSPIIEGVKQMAMESTAHGIERVGSGPPKRSIFWAILFALCMFMVTKQSWVLIEQYLEYGKVRFISIGRSNGSHFPLVTICNYNLLDKSAMDKINSKYSSLQILNTLAKSDLADMDLFFRKVNNHDARLFALKETENVLSQWVNSSEVMFNNVTYSMSILAKCLQKLCCTNTDPQFRCHHTVVFVQKGFLSLSQRGLKDGAYLTFPNVTTLIEQIRCHDLLIDLQLLKQLQKKYSQIIEKSEFTHLMDFYRNSKSKDYGDVLDTFRTMDLHSLKDMSMQPSEFIVSCQFKGIKCSPKDFTLQQSNLYGNCYTFNPPNGVVNKASDVSVVEKGLSLTVRVEKDPKSNILSSTSGLRVAVHEIDTTHSVIEDRGTSTTLGAISEIQFYKKEIHRLNLHKSGCMNKWPFREVINVSDVVYNKKLCEQMCVNLKMQETCGCTTSLVYSRYRRAAPFCDMLGNRSQHECWANLQLERKSALDNCSRQCLVACNEVQYELTLSSLRYPLIDFLNSSIKELMISSNRAANIDGNAFMNSYSTILLNSTNETRRYEIEELMETFAKSYGKLRVFQTDEEYENIQEQRETMLENVLAEVGGILGLWIGVSAISIIEFLEMIFYVVYSCLYFPKKRSSSSQFKSSSDWRPAQISQPSSKLLSCPISIDPPKDVDNIFVNTSEKHQFHSKNHYPILRPSQSQQSHLVFHNSYLSDYKPRKYNVWVKNDSDYDHLRDSIKSNLAKQKLYTRWRHNSISNDSLFIVNDQTNHFYRHSAEC